MQDREKMSEIKNHALLLLGQVILLLICFAYMNYVYTFSIAPERKVKESYERANCLIVNKKLSTDSGWIHDDYRADFLVTYTINDIQYSRWVSGNGLDMSYTSDKASQDDLLNVYDIGNSYTCYYDAANPASVTLTIRHNWLSTFPLMIPAVISIILLYYIGRSLAILSTLLFRYRE